MAVAAILIAGFLRTPASGQSTPRTEWGRPDLRGVFTFATVTPLERPDDLGGREVLTDEDARKLEAEAAQRRVDRPPQPGDTGTYNRFWVDYGTRVASSKRASLITDPSGKLPPLSEQAKARNAARVPGVPRAARGYEDMSFTDRCIAGFNTGPPFLPSSYNNTVQLFQTPDSLVILNEMIHDARIVPLDGRPHLNSSVRQLMGDSRGRWDGDTLVVETTNFATSREVKGPAIAWRHSRVHSVEKAARLIERFKRIDKDTVEYAFTLDDPATWMHAWSAAFPLVRIDGPGLFEYACHEGNYALAHMLGGARADEQR